MNSETNIDQITIVINGRKLTRNETLLSIDYINAYHDGSINHGELISRINRKLGRDRDD